MDVVIIAALVGAVSAFIVSAFDRRWAARDERQRWERSDRRHVYAQFLGASTDVALRKGEPVELALRFGELQLVASQEVQDLAMALFSTVLQKGYAGESGPDRSAFVAAARRELGYAD